MREQWKDIEDYEGHYSVSNTGKVKSIDRTFIRSNGRKYHVVGNILKQSNSRGYKVVNLRGRVHFVHRLIAQAFIPNPDDKPHINHIDGDKSNNSIDNLEWVTNEENLKHAWDNGLLDNSGENCGTSKLTNNDVLQIRSLWEQGWVTQSELSEAYNVTSSAICNIVNRNRWKHI